MATSAEVEFFARQDMAEHVGRWIERQAALFPDVRISAEDVTRFADIARLFDDEPEAPTPAAPNVVPFRPRPFDRAAHCQAIAAGGGARTVALYGTQHMRAIGRAGARATIERHGLATFRGIVAAKGWAGPRRPDLLADLAAGRDLADRDRAA